MPPDVSFNPYEVLGLHKGCTEKDIQKAYKVQCLKWHPDKNLSNKEEAERRFIAAKKAFEFLFDKEKKHEFDSKAEKQRAKEEKHKERMEKADGERKRFINELERREKDFAEKKGDYRPSKTAEESEMKYKAQQRKAQEAEVRAEFEEIRKRLEKEASDEIAAQQERIRHHKDAEMQKKQDCATLCVRWKIGKEGEDYDSEQLGLIFKDYGRISDVYEMSSTKKGQRKFIVEFEEGQANWGAETESGVGGPTIKAKWLVPPKEATTNSKNSETGDGDNGEAKNLEGPSEFHTMTFEELQAKLLADILPPTEKKTKKWHEEVE